MKYEISYPKPDIKFSKDFFVFILDNRGQWGNNVITSPKLRIMLINHQVKVFLNGDVLEIKPLPFTETRKIEYICSGTVNLNKVVETRWIKVSDYYFPSDKISEIAQLLSIHRSREIDFYLIKTFFGIPVFLGLGTNCSFILLAGTDIRYKDHKPLLECLWEYTYKLPSSLEKETKPSKIEIDVPDHIVERWIKELGLNL